jgi:hypothetical protein
MKFQGLVVILSKFLLRFFKGKNASINAPQTSFCINDNPETFTALQPNGTWSHPQNGFTQNPDGSVTFNPSQAGVGSHNLTYTIGGACGDVRTIPLVVTDSPSAPSLVAATYCLDDAPFEIFTTDSTAIFNWYSDANGDNLLASSSSSYLFNPTATGVYTICAAEISSAGCVGDIACVQISVRKPTASFEADPIEGNIPFEVSIENNSSGATSFEWDFGNGTFSEEENPDAVLYNDWGTFTITLTVTDDYGCSDSMEQLITANTESEIIIPNVFTPNGDGINDLFKVTASFVISPRRKNI